MSTSVFIYEPFYGFDRLFGDARRGANDRANCGSATAVQRALRPRMDLHENADSNTVTATFELPGLSKENVQIDVHNSRLTISGESQISSGHDESGYAIRERGYGKFARTLQLPRGVTDEQIAAKMENGILTVTFPSSTPETTPKKISVV